MISRSLHVGVGKRSTGIDRAFLTIAIIRDGGPRNTMEHVRHHEDMNPHERLFSAHGLSLKWNIVVVGSPLGDTEFLLRSQPTIHRS